MTPWLMILISPLDSGVDETFFVKLKIWIYFPIQDDKILKVYKNNDYRDHFRPQIKSSEANMDE